MAEEDAESKPRHTSRVSGACPPPAVGRAANRWFLAGGAAVALGAVLLAWSWNGRGKMGPDDALDRISPTLTHRTSDGGTVRVPVRSLPGPVRSTVVTTVRVPAASAVAPPECKAPFEPEECWLSGAVDGPAGHRTAGKNQIILWIRCNPTPGASIPGTSFQLNTNVATLIAPGGSVERNLGIVLHPSDPRSTLEGVSYAFLVPADVLGRLSLYRIRLRDEPPLPIRAVFRPLSFVAGEDPVLRWSGATCRMTISGVENTKGLVTLDIQPEALEGWTLKVTGAAGKRLLFDQTGSYPNNRFVWADQPYEVRDPVGNVLSRNDPTAPKDAGTTPATRDSLADANAPPSTVPPSGGLMTFLPGRIVPTIQVSDGVNSIGVPRAKPIEAGPGHVFYVVECTVNTVDWPKERIDFLGQEGVHIFATDIDLVTQAGAVIHPANAAFTRVPGSAESLFETGPLRSVALIATETLVSGRPSRLMRVHIARPASGEGEVIATGGGQIDPDPRAFKLAFAFPVPQAVAIEKVSLLRRGRGPAALPASARPTTDVAAPGLEALGSYWNKGTGRVGETSFVVVVTLPSARSMPSPPEFQAMLRAVQGKVATPSRDSARKYDPKRFKLHLASGRVVAANRLDFRVKADETVLLSTQGLSRAGTGKPLFDANPDGRERLAPRWVLTERDVTGPVQVQFEDDAPVSVPDVTLSRAALPRVNFDLPKFSLPNLAIPDIKIPPISLPPPIIPGLNPGGMRSGGVQGSSPRAGRGRRTAAGKAEPGTPRHATAATLLSMGANLEKAGNTKAALSYYQRLRDEFPGSGEADEAGDRIRALAPRN